MALKGAKYSDNSKSLKKQVGKKTGKTTSFTSGAAFLFHARCATVTVYRRRILRLKSHDHIIYVLTTLFNKGKTHRYDPWSLSRVQQKGSRKSNGFRQSISADVVVAL